MNNIELWQGDCLSYIPNIPKESVDLILIDPPYIISKDSGYMNNSVDRQDYIAKYGNHKIDLEEIIKNDKEILHLIDVYL